MKVKIILAISLLGMTWAGTAQVFTTSSTLRSGDIEIGLEPGIYVNSDADFNLFVHGGVGITKGVDMALKLGVMGTQAYFGGDVEFGLSRNFSVAAGAHSYGVFGLDAMGLYTFNLGDHSKLYTGLDADLNFPENADMQLPVWLPVGVEIPVKKYILFRMEAEVSLTDAGSHYFGGGLSFLF